MCFFTRDWFQPCPTRSHCLRSEHAMADGTPSRDTDPLGLNSTPASGSAPRLAARRQQDSAALAIDTAAASPGPLKATSRPPSPSKRRSPTFSPRRREAGRESPSPTRTRSPPPVRPLSPRTNGTNRPASANAVRSAWTTGASAAGPAGLHVQDRSDGPSDEALQDFARLCRELYFDKSARAGEIM